MALTSRIIANVYGKNGNALESGVGTVTGRLNYFSNSGNQFYAAPLTGPNYSFNGITVNSVVEVYPTGLKVNSDKYYCVETVAQLVTNGS
jgi:hypothetical protein